MKTIDGFDVNIGDTVYTAFGEPFVLESGPKRHVGFIPIEYAHIFYKSRVTAIKEIIEFEKRYLASYEEKLKIDGEDCQRWMSNIKESKEFILEMEEELKKTEA